MPRTAMTEDLAATAGDAAGATSIVPEFTVTIQFYDATKFCSSRLQPCSGGNRLLFASRNTLCKRNRNVPSHLYGEYNGRRKKQGAHRHMNNRSNHHGEL